MSPTRSEYKELGLDLVETLQDQPHKPQQPPMAEENKDEGVGDPFKILTLEVPLLLSYKLTSTFPYLREK